MRVRKGSTFHVNDVTLLNILRTPSYNEERLCFRVQKGIRENIHEKDSNRQENCSKRM